MSALRELNEHPNTVFTVLTGEGRLFSAGADVKAAVNQKEVQYASSAEKKIAYMESQAKVIELLRSMIDHKKVLVLALNGPAVGGGATWFPGSADIVLAADDVYLQAPFSALGLVPEYGSATQFFQLMGPRRANDFLMFGSKMMVKELKDLGVVNRVFAKENFHAQAVSFLEEQLNTNDGESMMEAKRLQNEPLRKERLLALYDSFDALAERITTDAHKKRFEQQDQALSGESGTRKFGTTQTNHIYSQQDSFEALNVLPYRPVQLRVHACHLLETMTQTIHRKMASCSFPANSYERLMKGVYTGQFGICQYHLCLRD